MSTLQHLEDAMRRKLSRFLESSEGGLGIKELVSLAFRAPEEAADLAAEFDMAAPYGLLSYPIFQFADEGQAGNVTRTVADVTFILVLAQKGTPEEQKAFYFAAFDIFSTRAVQQIFSTDEKPTGWDFVRFNPIAGDVFTVGEVITVSFAWTTRIRSTARCATGA
jgi:hypothetical protein